MSKEVLNFGLALSKLEESQLMTLITCLHWEDKDAQYRSASTSSNPTKVGGPDMIGRYM
jgi:hypothetical protein